MRLVLFDVDDTLFDWLDMWSSSFRGLLDALRSVSSLESGEINAAFRRLHVKVGTSEYPYSADDLVELLAIAPGDAHTIAHEVDGMRVSKHVLFDGVERLLHRLREKGVRIALHTDSPPAVASRRFKKLRINTMVDAAFSTFSALLPDPDESHVYLPHRKPSSLALESILAQLGVNPSDAVYVGDSLLKDISMAQACGVRDVHAAYGDRRGAPEYDLLRAVSHWTDADIEFERSIARTVTASEAAASVKDLSQLLGCG